MDDFFRNRVTQYERRRLGKTFVATLPSQTRVLGYYTLAAGAVSFSQLPRDLSRKLPKHPLPVVLLARLAVDRGVQGRRLGESLLMDALQRSLQLSSQLGIHAMTVDAIDSSAVTFYRKYGFISLPEDPQHLFLPLATIATLFGK